MTASPRWATLFCCAVAACDPPEADRVRAGDIAVFGGHAYMPVGPEAAAYVSLRNTGRTEDTLLSIGSPLADTVTLHDFRQEGGSLRVAMQAGKKLPLRLQFARAGMIEIDVPIVRYAETH